MKNAFRRRKKEIDPIDRYVLENMGNKIKQTFEGDFIIPQDYYERGLLEDYSDWLHRKGYIDADYYAEEPKAVDAYLQHLKTTKKV